MWFVYFVGTKFGHRLTSLWSGMLLMNFVCEREQIGCLSALGDTHRGGNNEFDPQEQVVKHW